MRGSKEKHFCPFCSGTCVFRYSMNEYSIWQCQKCKTGCVWPMPNVETLKSYYNGFLPALDENKMSIIKLAAKKLFLHLDLSSGANFEMLDIGGGGGFFSKAFEDLGYGKSTYVDIDPKSCMFAENNLNLKRVFNCDALNIQEFINKKFDFVYCRHVIEHLQKPVDFLKKMMGVLKYDGLFFIQCPNGDSLEYLAYPRSTLRGRIQKICKTNLFSKSKVIWLMLTDGMLHGIDPPRHLWAMTKQGITALANTIEINCKISTYPLWNLAYSPYYYPETFSDKVQAFIGRYILSPIHGGTHLVALLSHKNR